MKVILQNTHKMMCVQERNIHGDVAGKIKGRQVQHFSFLCPSAYTEAKIPLFPTNSTSGLLLFCN